MAIKPKQPSTKVAAPKAAKPMGASTDRIVLDPIEARYIGDQLRGIAYLSKKLALAIREKKSPVPFDPADIDAMSETAYALARSLELNGDDGSNGG